MAIQFIDPKKAKPGTRMVSVIGEPTRVVAGEGGQVTAKKTQAAGKTEALGAAVKTIAAGGRRAGKSEAQKKALKDPAALEVDAGSKGKRGPKKTGGAKAQITLRLDQDIIDKFKAAGAGWQSKINDALRAYLKLGAKK